jgi:hypothetical protein
MSAFAGNGLSGLVSRYFYRDRAPGASEFMPKATFELSIKANVPEWSNQEVSFALEQDAAYTKTGAAFLDKRQTTLFLIR